VTILIITSSYHIYCSWWGDARKKKCFLRVLQWLAGRILTSHDRTHIIYFIFRRENLLHSRQRIYNGNFWRRLHEYSECRSGHSHSRVVPYKYYPFFIVSLSFRSTIIIILYLLQAATYSNGVYVCKARSPNFFFWVNPVVQNLIFRTVVNIILCIETTFYDFGIFWTSIVSTVVLRRYKLLFLEKRAGNSLRIISPKMLTYQNKNSNEYSFRVI